MRRERSVLAVPASNWRMIEKAAVSAADIAFLDLEDAVAPGEKVAGTRDGRAGVPRARLGGQAARLTESMGSTRPTSIAT